MTFFDIAGDKRMAHQNEAAWEAIAQCVMQVDGLPERRLTVLDWGCHNGGLLDTLATKIQRIENFYGVEPDAKAREEARGRLGGCESHFWETLTEVPDQSVDIFVSHETLYLVKLIWFFRELKRVLRPDGAAFIALGSHSENPTWLGWRLALANKYGHSSYVHDPWNIVEQGHEAGFTVGYQELWPAGYPTTNWYSPPEDGWGEFESMEEALAFRRAKLLFQFWPRQ